MAASQANMEKMQVRQNYRNLWHSDLMGTIQADTRYCCFSFFCVCACMQTQHKIEMDKRDGMFGPQPMAVPQFQQMSRIDQQIPPNVGYPPQPAYGQPYGYPPPPQAQGYPPQQAQGYPPAGYPPPGYPPSR